MKILNNLLPNIKEKESLAQYTTFRIGGTAKYFFVAQSSDDVIKAIQAAQKIDTPFFILGGGSNLLINDSGFNGLVIKVSSSKLQILNDVITVDAGVPLAKLVIEAAQKGLAGLEWATGIPGTIGGAIRGNAGAYGHSIGELIKTIMVLKFQDKSAIVPSIAFLSQNECRFSYRDSVFKQNKNLITLEATIQLSRGDKEKSRQQMKELIKTRQGKLPQESCAGSVFKNYELQITDYELLKEQFSQAGDEDIKKWVNFKKIPSAWLVEQCNLKGKQIGQAQISPKHANTIINLGGAQAKDVLKIIDLIKKKVQDKFNIQLEEEIELVGF